MPALLQLCQTTAEVDDDTLQSQRIHLCQILQQRFPTTFDGSVMETKDEDLSTMQVDNHDSDEPVVVPHEQVQASLERSSNPTPSKPVPPQYYPKSLQDKYPILFAAKMDHEDILMTCARALDAATDVSLVREASEYLVEEVEPDTSGLG